MRSLARLFALLLLSTLAGPAMAGWPNQPNVTVPVTRAAANQYSPKAVSDGAGGAIITWEDSSGTSTDIFAQHVLGSGVVDPAWPVNGRALCTAAGAQLQPVIASDGAGGAIVEWSDQRAGASNADIYAMRVLATGALAPGWPANGRLVCDEVFEQINPAIASDGAGGAVLSWQDGRPPNAPNVYAQHLLASGAVDPAWPVNGRAICTAQLGQGSQSMISDGAGGAVIAWHDYRNFAWDIYAQHVFANGTVDPRWPVDGKAVSTALYDQTFPVLVSDDAGGAIIVWTHTPYTTLVTDLYAMHLLGSGVLDATWPAAGVAVSTATGHQTNPVLVRDGAGGAIIAWRDLPSAGQSEIYATRVLESGNVDPAWPLNGRAICTAPFDQVLPAIVEDGSGGAIIAWEDHRTGAYADIYAQHVLGTGVVDTGWPANGRAMATSGTDHLVPTGVSDGAGGMIVAWQEGAVATGTDVSAARVARYGYLGSPEPELVSARDVPNDQGGVVKLSWNASYLEGDAYALVTSYRLYRSVPATAALSLIASGARSARALDADDQRPASADELLLVTQAGPTGYWEFVASVAADFLPSYSALVPTAQDSTAAGGPQTAFMIQARTAANQHWESVPVFGYSVDNLAPAAPAAFAGVYASGHAALTWNRSPEPDVAGYRLYRGASAGFVPGPGNLIGAFTQTSATDATGTPAVYKLTAIDAHGNESPAAMLVPTGALGVGDGAPLALAFAAPSPNPARGSTLLYYTLSRAGHVRLSVFDAAGRRVTTLHDGEQQAGAHSASFALRDAAGQELASGLFLLQLEAEGRVLTRRLVTIR